MKDTRFSKIFVPVTWILLIGGLIILASASSVIGQQKFNDPLHFVKQQLAYIVIAGLPGFVFFSFIFDHRTLKKISLFLFILNIIFLLLTFIPQFSLQAGTAYRWIVVGPITIQPSEFLKITFIVLVAAILSNKSESELKSFTKTTLPFLCYLILIGLILLSQPSTSTFILLSLVALVLYFYSGASLSHLIIAGIILALVLAVFLLIVPRFHCREGENCVDYRIRRIQAFLNPSNKNIAETYQPYQAKIGLGSGGWLGKGFGQSRQKYNYLPESYTDTVFAVIGEEFGFIGSFITVMLYFLFFLSGISLVRNSQNLFSSLLALGLISWITIQAFIHCFSASSLLPLSGTPLPFISYGGSLMTVTLWSLGILNNIRLKNHL